MPFVIWCPGPESNRHGVLHRGILSPLRLPIPPPGHRRRAQVLLTGIPLTVKIFNPLKSVRMVNDILPNFLLRKMALIHMGDTSLNYALVSKACITP